ncbi:unnamed protein product [Ceratitis capitata]|uniref:(Mediterranean fruit fly) hypothetical protein n=1 Tax=Ceratitis capitata TaxID=7213 RepID=A0A811V3E5_CERCA|nr:unnamed protein product [Ceratitis capitata]
MVSGNEQIDNMARLSRPQNSNEEDESPPAKCKTYRHRGCYEDLRRDYEDPKNSQVTGHEIAVIKAVRITDTLSK